MHKAIIFNPYHVCPLNLPKVIRYQQPAISHARHYARQQQRPAFDSSQPSKAKAKKKASPAEEKSEESRPKPFRIRPGRIIFFSILAYLGYRVYTWQTNPQRSQILNPHFFHPFILKSREQVSSSSIVLNLLSLPAGQNTENVSETWRRGVWSVQVMQPELQIARSYTPLPPGDASPAEQVRLFVRKELQGEVSSFLHRISPGTLVHLRGPHIEYEIPEDVDEILFLAGGTGIAPALQVVHTVFKARQRPVESLPTMRILWANRRREDALANPEDPSFLEFESKLAAKLRDAFGTKGEIDPANSGVPDSRQKLLVEEVAQLPDKYQGKVKVEYFVDEDGSYITEALLRKYLGVTVEQSKGAQSLRSYITEALLRKYLGVTVEQSKGAESLRTNPKRIALVSGPDGFVNVYGGPKEWQGGKEISGPLGGLLGKINPTGWDICKL